MPRRLAVICDYPEEDWPSMDLCAQMLLDHLAEPEVSDLVTEQVVPQFNWRLRHLPWMGHRRGAFNGDRLLNRFVDYPAYLRQHAQGFDYYHVCDHTYAQLVHELPAARTGVFCHDLDAFRSLLEPEVEPRPGWYRFLARRILTGLQKATVVFYTTAAVRQQIEQFSLVDPARLVHTPLGIAPEFTATPTAVCSEALPPELTEHPFLLHVGSCIPRKRIDVLLEIFAALQQRLPDVRLVKAGGTWTTAQQDQIHQLGIQDQIIHLPHLDRSAIATLYRQAAIVLLTSEAEGFGLPVIEALACGAIVVASDIPVLREVGGAAVVYCPLGDIPTWVQTIERVLAHPDCAPERQVRLRQASQYSWSTHAQKIAAAYLQLPPPPSW